jgi:ABC-2 type transport system permease protein
MMFRGLWRLTWLEVRIFLREPLGVVGAVGVPVVLFVLFGRMFGGQFREAPAAVPRLVGEDLPILASMLIVLGAVLSLVTIVSIYRESGILKRLRATPLRPPTILTAHVIVKLLLTSVTLVLLVVAGRRVYPIGPDVPLVSFAAALLLTTVSVLSIGFVIASLVPTARFAQPIGTLVLYPMLGVSGLFVPIDVMPPMLQLIARVLPLTYGVSLLRGIWHAEGWSAHAGDVIVLVLTFVVCTALSSRVFRWE